MKKNTKNPMPWWVDLSFYGLMVLGIIGFIASQSLGSKFWSKLFVSVFLNGLTAPISYRLFVRIRQKFKKSDRALLNPGK